MIRLYAVIGAGGFGREVMPIAKKMLNNQLSNINYKLVFVDQKIENKFINHYEVMSFEDFISCPDSEKYFTIAIAHSRTRQDIAEQMIKNGITPFSIYAENTVELECNKIGVGSILCPFSCITSNATIGKFFHANIFSYVAHDCIIGDYVTFSPKVCCNGGVIIEDNVFIGTGACIKQGTAEKPIILGEGAIIGMGAIVTKSVSPYTTVIGNPARLLCNLEPKFGS